MASLPSAAARRPTVGVSVLVRKDGSVLLIRRRREPYAGMWAFPGGHVEWGETLADAAIREVREETGIAVDRPRPIDTLEIMLPDEDGAVARHIVLFVFEARYRSGTPSASDDAAEARWFRKPKLSSLDLTPEVRDVIATVARKEAAR